MERINAEVSTATTQPAEADITMAERVSRMENSMMRIRYLKPTRALRLNLRGAVKNLRL